VQLPATFGVREHPECFIVRDANGQALAYVYFEGEPERRAAARLLTRDEARRQTRGCQERLRRFFGGRTDSAGNSWTVSQKVF
jgi:hypothetical protein